MEKTLQKPAETVDSYFSQEYIEKIKGYQPLIETACSALNELEKAGFEITLDIQPGTAYDNGIKELFNITESNPIPLL